MTVAGWCDGVVFDMDGTIADTESLTFQAWVDVWADHGATLELSTWAATIGTRDVLDPVQLLAQRLGVTWDDDERAAIAADQRKRYTSSVEHMRPRAGVVDWVRAAQAHGLPLAVASSSETDWVRHKLDVVGLLDAFPIVVGYDEVGHKPKPDPASHLEACRRLGIAPAAALAIEDSPNGVTAAVTAGLRTVACPGPMTVDADLSIAPLRVLSLADLAFDDALRDLA